MNCSSYLMIRLKKTIMTGAALAAAVFIAFPGNIYAATTVDPGGAENAADNNLNDEGATNDVENGIYSSSDYIKPGNTWLTPLAVHGQDVIIALPIVNMTPYNIKDVVVTPILSGKTDNWPFEITQTNYALNFDVLLGSNAEPDVAARTKTVFWTFRTRDDVDNGYYNLSFEILYLDDVCNQGRVVITTYCKCVGKDGAKDHNSDEELKESTPRIIVTGFTTDPEVIKAGQEFDLTIDLKNTSNKTSVNNVEVNLSAIESGEDSKNTYAAFLPTEGSNTYYFARIPAGATDSIQMRFKSKADLAQQPYVMKLDMKYEDDKNNPYEAENSVSIPVTQESKFTVSTFEVSPESVEVGGEGYLAFNVYNTGKTILYNTRVEVRGDSINDGDAFIGNLDSGATGNVEVVLIGKQATTDDGKLKVTVFYEDDTGAEFSQDFDATFFVNEMMMDDAMGDYGDYAEEIPVEKPFPTGATIAIAAVAAVAVAAVIIVLVRRARKKKKQELELEDLD